MGRYSVTLISKQNFIVEAENAKQAEDIAMNGEFETTQYRDIPDFEWESKIYKVPDDEIVTLSHKIVSSPA